MLIFINIPISFCILINYIYKLYLYIIKEKKELERKIEDLEKKLSEKDILANPFERKKNALEDAVEMKFQVRKIKY